MAANYTNILYKDYEDVSQKLEKVLLKLDGIEKKHKEEIKDIRKEHRRVVEELKEENKQLQLKLDKANETIDKLVEENDRLKNRTNKNSSNSSKPSSTDMYKPKKTGPNIYNSRVKTNKKVGGQPEHKGHNLGKEKIEQAIAEGKVESVVIEHEIKGDESSEPIVKYKLGMKVITYVEKHIFKFNKNSQNELPKEFYTDVTYTNEFKALTVFLNVHNVISLNRLSQFYEIITHGIINLSQGSIVNFMKEFSAKSIPSIDNIIEDVLDGKTLYTDETVSKENSQKAYVRNYSNIQSVVYLTHLHKGHNPIKEDGILTKYTGTVMGDHDTTLDSYGRNRIECNVHLGRYTVEITQNVFDAPWAEKMKTLLETGNRTRKHAEGYGLKGFDGENFKWYEDQFDEIIKEAKEETKQMSSSYYRGKSKTLYSRLEKNKDKHLAYLKDFSLPFSNNLSESDLRVYKIKIKVSGCFRSKSGADCFADALSIVKTSKKRKENIFDNILKIFNGEALFAK